MILLETQNETSTVETILQQIQTVAATAGNILRSSNTQSAFVVAFAKLVKYVRFLQVPLTPKIREALCYSTSSVVFSFSMAFTVSLPDTFKHKFTKCPIPSVFDNSGYHSSYLVNH